MKPESPRTLVDALLAEQRTLTAVEKFSHLHERDPAPLLEPHYRDLIPLHAPRPGEQYAFEVDLDRCSGCKGCVTACHSLNGLDDGESWREVGALLGEALVPELRGGNRVVPLRQTVTTACHHCVEPACLLGCPVLAYDKDPATGIVRHLDDQCIGCSYCVMQCPYEVPKYSAQRGIVRKCDMCHDRLAAGEAPACVQACPNEAIRITVVGRESLRAEYRPRSSRCEETTSEAAAGRSRASSEATARKNGFLSDSPDPALTVPATRYVSSKPGAPLLAADHFRLAPAASHWPLVWMLVLTQAGVGGWMLTMFPGLSDSGDAFWPGAVSSWLFFGGLAASVFHLGRPLKAWRIWLGWRTSWLSREAIALSAFAAIAGIAFAARWTTLAYPALERPWSPVLVTGFLAILAQAMVYADTRRLFWRFAATFPRFLGTAVILGLALQLCFRASAMSAFALIGATLAKLAVEISVLKHGDSDATCRSELQRTALLQTGPLRLVLGTRLLLALAGGGLIPFALGVQAIPAGWAVLAGVLCLAGEVAERWLFFASVAPDRMPGPA